MQMWESAGPKAGYRSKIVNIGTDTLTSIPIPKWYFSQYHFSKIYFNIKKITLWYYYSLQRWKLFKDLGAAEETHACLYDMYACSLMLIKLTPSGEKRKWQHILWFLIVSTQFGWCHENVCLKSSVPIPTLPAPQCKVHVMSHWAHMLIEQVSVWATHSKQVGMILRTVSESHMRKLVRIHLLDTMNICTTFQGNPLDSWWHTSVWTQMGDWQTNKHCHSEQATNMSKNLEGTACEEFTAWFNWAWLYNVVSATRFCSVLCTASYPTRSISELFACPILLTPQILLICSFSVLLPWVKRLCN